MFNRLISNINEEASVAGQYNIEEHSGEQTYRARVVILAIFLEQSGTFSGPA